MKTFAALIRRYVLATAAIVLLVGGLLVGQIFYVGFKSNAVDATGYRVGALADALKQTETGLQWGREHTPAEWMQGYAWAMVLDDNGNVIWQHGIGSCRVLPLVPGRLPRAVLGSGLRAVCCGGTGWNLLEV